MFSSAFVYVRLGPHLDLSVGTRLIFASCPGILVTWSPKDVDEGIQASLTQIYPILLSTLVSIKRQSLTLFDATFALLLTSSPLTVYLVVASICDLCGFETNLYKRIKSYRRTIRFFGAMIPFLWLGLSLTLTFSDKAFKNSGLCRGSSFTDWLLDVFWSLIFYSPLLGGYFGLGLGIIPALALAFMLCLFRRRSQAKESFRVDMEGKSKLRRALWTPWMFVKCVWCVSVVAVPSWAKLMLSRCTVDHNHRWCTFSLFMFFEYNWAAQVIASAVYASMKHRDYVISYGQVCGCLCAPLTIGYPLTTRLPRG